MGGTFNTILGGVERGAEVIGDALVGTGTGAAIGEIGGPIGMGIGALVGAIGGFAHGSKNLVDYVHHHNNGEAGPSVGQTAERLVGYPGKMLGFIQGSGAAGIGASKKAGQLVGNIQRGMSVGSAIQASGATRVPEQIANGGVQGVINRAHAASGVNPTYAMAIGSPVMRGALGIAAGRGGVFSDPVSAMMQSAAHPTAAVLGSRSGVAGWGPTSQTGRGGSGAVAFSMPNGGSGSVVS